MSERYAELRDYNYPLQPDITYRVGLRNNQLFSSENSTLNLSGAFSWLLPLHIRTTALGRWREPSVEVRIDGQSYGRQYFEPGANGRRFLDLGQPGNTSALPELIAHDCQLNVSEPLMGWRLPQLADGPLLILAPHPDDAEIAAYGLYRHFHEQVWIITLTPGERLPRLDRQYLQGLDDDLSKATRRKGELRSWNAATTPMLAGVPIQQHVMLGHFNRHLNEMLATPEHSFSHPVVAGLTPDHFRCHNQLSLPTDSRAACRGYDLLEELEFLLGHIQPTTIVLPDPLLDPHPDHIATGHALRHAISRQGTAPQRLLSYTNHLRGTTLFPYGPAGARTSLPPANLVDQPAGGYFSFSLSPELQREKTTALMTMSDLQAPVSLERQLKRRLKDRLLHQHWRDPARHAYFRTAIKHNEVFRLFGRIEELVPEHQKV